MTRPQDERRDAAIRVSSQVDGVSSPGNPMWALSVEAACGSNPDATLAEALGGTSGTAAGEDSAGQPTDADDGGASAAAEDTEEAAEPAPTPGPDGNADDETVSAVRDATGPPTNERIYSVVWENGQLQLDTTPASIPAVRDVCEDIKQATGADSVAVLGPPPEDDDTSADDTPLLADEGEPEKLC